MNRLLPEFEIDPRRAALQIPADRYSLQIQTTTACNAKCAFCPHETYYGGREVRQMEQSVFERILCELKGYRFYKIAPYLQNEPLCDPRIFERMQRIQECLTYDLIEVSVNPGMLTPSRIQGLVQTLSQTPHQIRVSFHGVDAAGFERSMALPFARCLRQTLALLQAAQEAGLSVMIKGLGRSREQNGPAADFDESAFLSFWREQCRAAGLDASLVTFRYGLYHSRCGNAGVSSAPVRPNLEGFYCSRVDRWLHFLCDGSLILCCNDYAGESVFGNIREESLSSILAGERYSRLSSMLRGERPSPDDFFCKRCTSPGG